MTTTTTTRGRIRRLLVAGALAAAVAAPLAVAATPASAATTSGGCTLTPLTPVFDGFTSAGVKIVKFPVKITCAANRTVTVLQSRWENDAYPDPDDNLGSVTFSRSFTDARTITVSSRRTLPNTENGNEEIYQRVRFRVTSNGVTSPWTSGENSRQVSMPN